MNKIYKFSLVIIVLIFLFIEYYELQNTINLNNTVLLEKSLNSNNKKYLINELADINKIKEVSVKFQNEEQDSDIQEFKIKTKTPSGRNSIYVEALQSISNSRKRIPSRGFNFNLQDPITGHLIRPSVMLEADITCGN